MPGPGDPLNVIQRGELNLRLARGLEVRQRSGQGLLLADQVVPVVTLEDLTQQSLSVEPGERRAYMCTGVIAAVVGQSGYAAVFNPVGSGALLVVRGFNVSMSTTSQIVWGLADPLALPANPVTPWWNDFRQTGIPLALARSDTQAVLRIVTEHTRTGIGATTVSNPTWMPNDWSIVLQEGQAFGGQAVVQNQPATFSFIWDEIPLR
jgi:hypothetical protein